jgi:hypothetical protein
MEETASTCQQIINEVLLCEAIQDDETKKSECETNKSKLLTSCATNSTCRHFIQTCVNDFDMMNEIAGIEDKKKAAESNRERCVDMFDICAKPCIDDDVVQTSLDQWCTGLVKLSQRLADPDDMGENEPSKAQACREFVKEYYAFDDNLGTVASKMKDEESAVAYFCGNGFANTHWVGCKVERKATRIDGCTATVVGSLTLTPATPPSAASAESSATPATFEETWTLVNAAGPLLQLVGHHSSM